MVARAIAALLVAGLGCAADATADPLSINRILQCQKQLAIQGARFAKTTVKNTLKCTNEVVECQVNCEQGAYGPPCETDPPPCCDPDDPESNPAFGECMEDAEATCLDMEGSTADAEQRKRDRVTDACDELTLEELCGAETPGLSFATLNAGCAALIPGYQCSLTGILDCVGGPLQQQLGEQIGGLLDPRAPEALAALPALDAAVTGVPRTRKVKETLPADKVDLWSIEGNADYIIEVRLKTKDDAGGFSNLDAVLTYIDQDGNTPVANTNLTSIPCRPNTCGATCPSFKRRFPYTGTFFLAVRARTSNGCGGGGYALLATTATGAAPTLVGDDVDP